MKFVVSGQTQGRKETMRDPPNRPGHLAIRVSNFEEACKYRTNRDIESDKPKIKKGVKALFLKQPDNADCPLVL